MIEVELKGPLAGLAGGNTHISLDDAATVSEAVQSLAAVYPDLKTRFYIGNKISKRVIIYVNDTDIRFLQGDETEIPSGAELRIITALAGG